MKKNRFSEAQIVAILKQQQNGQTVVQITVVLRGRCVGIFEPRNDVICCTVYSIRYKGITH